jgi:hypothetical protein
MLVLAFWWGQKSAGLNIVWESLAYVRDEMGHKSIQITCDVYGHLVPGGNRAAVDRLDDETQLAATPAQPEGDSEELELPQVLGGRARIELATPD